LFADLRDFTQLCQRLDTEQSYQILNDVMDCLTDAVLAQQGTIIDYYGDGLAAMWNAPTPQADHALRAAHAARAMVDNIPAVSHRWSSQLPGELALGVGIHTGRAVVGNIGSSQHLKYGPRGATVNLASRIEASTKTLGMPVIVSTATHQQLAGVASVRLCQAQLKGIADVVDLYALLPDDIDSTTKSAIARYDQALAYFEQGLHGEACRLLERGLFGQLLGPSEFLSRQIKMQCSRRLGRRQSDCTSDCGPVVEV
jgi:adenylate cyclase